VLQILLEGVTAEPFVTRAEKRVVTKPLSALADVNYAIERGAKQSKAHAIKAEIMLLAGRPEESLKCASEAATLSPTTHAYRIAKAKALAALGRSDAAAQELSTVLADKSLAAHDKAAASSLLGDLVAASPEKNYKQALKLHMEAIEIADALSASANAHVRRTAKQVLVDAHLGAGQDIVRGPWNKKEQVVPKWVGRAAEAADDLVRNEGADPRTRLAFLSRALAVHAQLKGQPDAGPLAQDMLANGEKLIAASSDPLAQAQVRWQLASGLYSAMHISHAAAKAPITLQHGQAALAQLEAVRTGPYAPPEADYLLGQIAFRMGAVYAVLKEDHAQATTWYARALPLLEKPAPPSAVGDATEQAEALTSMGVSFWAVGQREKAVQLTAEGVHLFEKAVEEKLVEPHQLEVPYTNLASMHSELGDMEKSKQFAELAAKAKQGTLRK
jgi:tetratricopeptide (TPR) repeat protein